MNDADRKAMNAARAEMKYNTAAQLSAYGKGFQACCEWRDSQVREPVGWIFEDDLSDEYPYDALFPYSKVDVVRMFPVYAPQPAAQINQQMVQFIQEWLDRQGNDNNYMTEKAHAALAATQMRGDA